MLIIIVGRSGVGKGEFSKFLKNIPTYKTSEGIKKYLQKNGIKPNHKNVVREFNKRLLLDKYWAFKEISEIHKKAPILIVEGSRDYHIVKKLRQTFKNTIVIGIVSSKRFRYLQNRDNVTKAEFNQIEKDEGGNKIPKILRYLTDIKITNNGSLKQLKEKADIINLFLNRYEIQRRN